MAKYILKTAGRTGSHIICNYFLKHGYDLVYVKNDGNFSRRDELEIYEKSTNLLIHCHSEKWLPKSKKDYIFIHSYRENLFDRFCSEIITHYTDQYSRYDQIKKVPKIKIPIFELKKNIEKITLFDQKIEKQSKKFSFKNVVSLKYEEIAKDVKILFDLIPLDTIYSESIKTHIDKSPYEKSELIENYSFYLKRYKDNSL